jgi:uroporphyrinogen decarboxylase
MPYFLRTYMQGISADEFFDVFGLDSIRWPVRLMADDTRGEYRDPEQGEGASLDLPRIFSDNWRIQTEEIPDERYRTIRHTIATPRGNLSMVTQTNSYTDWVAERLIKHKGDLEIVQTCQSWPVCDVGAVNSVADAFDERGIVRGSVVSSDVYGQPGCWQDFCCMRGTEQAILDTYDDPQWVHEFLSAIQKRKLHFIESLRGARYDLMELGGGDASTTVISPGLFQHFVAPYDSILIEAAHRAGMRIVYHTCGGMMPILEDIAAMGADAMETFTPPAMGADVDLAEAKRRIGDRVCMIGAFDQGHYFRGCSPEETRAEVRRCFLEAGAGGGYILSPSDHFFDSDVELIRAFAEEARTCLY